MISIKNLHANVEDKQILKGLNLEIGPGEVHAIMGPNGAGKSTLLSMASRLTDSDAGEVVIGDKLLAEWDTKELAKHLAVLRQSNNINMRFTIRELVCFGRFPFSASVCFLESALCVVRYLLRVLSGVCLPFPVSCVVWRLLCVSFTRCFVCCLVSA